MKKGIYLKFLCSCIAAIIFIIGAASCTTTNYGAASTIKSLGLEQNQSTNNPNSNESPTNN